MMYHCPYCNWKGRQPSPSEYPDTLEGNQHFFNDLRKFADEQENHNCELEEEV